MTHAVAMFDHGVCAAHARPEHDSNVRPLTVDEMESVWGGDFADAVAGGAAAGFGGFGGFAAGATTEALLAEGVALGEALIAGAEVGLAFGVVGALAGAAVAGAIYLIAS